MKTVNLVFGLLFSVCVNAQTKSKIIPIDKSILKLSEDTTEKIVENKLSRGYVIRVNKVTNKRDTLISYKELVLIDKKRKFKS